MGKAGRWGACREQEVRERREGGREGGKKGGRVQVVAVINKRYSRFVLVVRAGWLCS